MDELDKENIDRWLVRSASQRKVLQTMLKSLKTRDLPDPGEAADTEEKTENKYGIMNKITQLFKKLGLLTVVVWLAGSLNLMAQDGDFVPGKVRVKVKPGSVELVENGLIREAAKGQQLKVGLTSLDKINARYAATEMHRVFPHAGKNEAKHIKHGLHLWYEIEVFSEADVQQVAREYGGNEYIAMAEAIRVKSVDFSEVEEAAAPATAMAMSTNDPYLADQWHLFNDGSLPNSLPGADINVMPAWDITVGSPEVIVAVVDGGIDVDHEDLKANMWVNQAELNGEDGVDDDFNGYVDDVYGYNFADNQGEITAQDHGTHVAGTVAATSNNGKGVAGVAGGSGNGDGIRMISAQVFSTEGSGNFAAAIVYGADNGAVISQNSWGYKNPGQYEQVVLDAIDYFIEEAGGYAGSPMKGGVVLFAAGNNGRDEMHYPSYYDKTIAIAASGTDYTKASYSNFGDWVDLITTGGDNRQGAKNAILSTLPENRYGYLQGTSMATPHASGIAALIVSKYGSATFTNEELRKRLFTGVREIETYNPEFIGKLGVGYMDAMLAVKPADEIAPEVIDDLSLVGISQDFATVSFTVPADSGDETPQQYRVYWSKDPGMTPRSEMIVNNDFREAGDMVEVTIEDLDFKTTYYFTVAAEDRWGNIAEMSSVIEGTTNQGPDIATDVSSFNFNVDTRVAAGVIDSMKVQNDSIGILNWTAETREISNFASYNKIELPESGNIKSVTQLEVNSQPIEMLEQFESTAAVQTAWEASEKKYFNISPLYVIGEIDTTMTNSSATKFDVSEAEGFNLTYVSAYLNLDQEDGNAVMEIYKGEDMHEDNLIYRDDRFAGRSENDSRYYNINLTEQLFFEQGETFWIVFHVPAGNLYPLGVGTVRSPEYKGRHYMSFDLGRTWESLSGIMQTDQWAWAVTASSKIEPLNQYITLTPNEGQIAGVGEENMDIDVDASQLINGTYRSNIVVSSNDEDTPIYRVPVTLNVSGHKPELSTFNILDFGSVFNGLSSTKEMTIINNGLGRFKTSSVTSSNPAFVVNSSTWSLNVAAKSESTMSMTYTPTGVGNENAVITMTSANGDVHQFNVFGVGTAPAEIAVAPMVIDLDSVMVGESVQADLSITNTGAYPLQYGFPAFAENLNHIENLPANVQRYPYAMETTPYDGYVFNDISATGTEVTDYFIQNSQAEFLNVELGFDFPFFGEKVDNLYITKRGALTVGMDGGFNSTSQFHGNHMPDGYIAAMLKEWALTLAGSVHYKRELGKFILQYTNVRHANDRDNVAVTFQIELYSNGDIKFIYDKFDGMFAYQLNSLFSAIENVEKNDGVLINSSYDKVSLPMAPQQIVEIHSPGIGLVKDVAESTGMIQPGETKDLVLTVDGEKLIEGSFTEYVAVLSNDPFNSSEAIEININVIGGGVSELVLSETAVDFGDVFQQATVNGTIAVKNEGSRLVDIANIAFANGQLSFSEATSLVIEPNQTFYVNYSLDTQVLGPVADTLVLTDSEGVTYEVAFTGQIVDAPAIEVVETSYTEAMEVDQEVIRAFQVKNTGAATLEYAIAASEHISVEEPSVAPDAVEEYTYVYRSTYDDTMKPTFQWIKLNEEDKVEFRVADGIYWEQLELPFEFDFYQEKYSKVWMSTQGALAFDEEVDLSYAPFTPPTVPKDDVLNNFIAPYFAAGGPNTQLPEDRWGRYMKAFDDKVVFEWRGYMNLFGIGGEFDIQAILYKNGKIKFQYKHDPNVPVRAFYGLIGMENKTGTDGIQLAHYQEYLANAVAVDIYPAKKETLEAGETRNYDLKFSTMGSNAAVYTESLKVINNTPLTPEVEVPVEIAVAGEPELRFIPDTVDLGEKMVVPGAAYEHMIAFTNTGKKTMAVSNLRVEDATTGVLEHLVYNFRWGWQWTAVRATDEFIIEPGFESKEFRLTVSPQEANANYMNKVLADTDFGTTEELPVMADFRLPPAFTVNQEAIYHMAFNNEVYSHTLNFGNFEGESPLSYTIGMTYDRPDATPAQAIQNAENEAVLLDNSNYMAESPVAVQNNTQFSNLLAHDDATQASTAVGFNGQSAFTSATRFIAPVNGFNLSHVQTWYAPGSWRNSEIIVDIRVGENAENGKSVHTEVLSYNAASDDFTGSLVTFALSETVEMAPFEKFHVVFTYPLGAAYPQGIADVDAHVPGRFVFFNAGIWWDIADGGFALSGWMVRAGEVTPAERNWLTIDGTIEGEVAVGGSYDVNVQLHPARTQHARNGGNLIIETNDPDMAMVTIPVTLEINQAPEVIADEVYYISENDTLELELSVVDNEGDMITDVTLVSEDNNVTMTYEKAVLNFRYTPDFEASGMHTFEIATEDENGITGISEIVVEVQDVNRKPEVIEIPTQYINLYTGDLQLEYADIFTDPDGEPMVYSASNSENDVIDLFENESAIMLSPLKLGVSTVTLRGVDPRGSEIATSFDVVVVGNVKDNAYLDKSWKVHPNPVGEVMNLKMYRAVVEALTINIYNTMGVLIKTVTSEGSDTSIQVPVEDLRPGVYFVELVTENAESVKKIVKQ